VAAPAIINWYQHFGGTLCIHLKTTQCHILEDCPLKRNTALSKHLTVHKVNTNDYGIQTGVEVTFQKQADTPYQYMRHGQHILKENVQQQKTLWTFFHILVMAEDDLGFPLYPSKSRRWFLFSPVC
jgi:hypothetical protein